MSPTFEDWLELMPLVAERGWRDEGRDGVVRDLVGRCPICALAYELSAGAVNYRGSAAKAAELLGVTNLVGVFAVMDAADYGDDERRPALLKALGMAA